MQDFLWIELVTISLLQVNKPQETNRFDFYINLMDGVNGKVETLFWLFQFCCFKLLFDVGLMTGTKTDYLYKNFELLFDDLKF